MDPTSDQVWRRRSKWIGHVLRMTPEEIARTALTRTPKGKQRKGRPKRDLAQDGGEKARKHGACHVGEGVKGDFRQGSIWRKRISGPISHEGKRKYISDQGQI